jgi:hypothetical protein
LYSVNRVQGMASEELFHGALADLRKVKSNSQYRKWAKKLARTLCKRWKEELGGGLDDPIAMKLVNLLAKALCSVSPIWPSKYREVARHIDVPLDKYSLQPLACVPELLDLRLNRASMGSVKSLDDYERIQKVIRSLCKRACLPAIAYDFVMWNGPHS